MQRSIKESITKIKLDALRNGGRIDIERSLGTGVPAHGSQLAGESPDMAQKGGNI